MRELYQDSYGFSFTRTELEHIIVGKDSCPEAIAVADLDGDGWPDVVALDSPGFNYSAQELVALHGPSGRIVWRALKGQLGKRLAVSNGVIVVESAHQRALHGVDSRSGQPLWSTALPGVVLDEPFSEHGNVWNAPAIVDLGSHVAVACDDDSVHLIESRTGRITHSRAGRLQEHNHGVPGIVAFLGGDLTNHELELWDVTANRSILKGSTHMCSPMALSADGVGYLFHADKMTNGAPATRVVVIDMATKQVRRSVWVTPGKGNVVPHNGLLCDQHRLAALGGDRLLLVSDDDERGGGIVIDLNAKTQKGNIDSVVPISRMPPPQSGYKLRVVERFARTVVAVWEHNKQHRIMAIGYDLVSLEPRWMLGDAGGVDMKNAVLRTDTALMLPVAPGGVNENSAGGLVHWLHVDPATGARVAQYGVSELDCSRMFGKYLVGHSTSFPGAPVVVWDTERRERCL